MERISRENYLSILKNFKDQQIIKVITGIRRCGKSTLLEIFQEYLKENGVWICGTDINAEKYYYNQDLTGPLGSVIGNEGKGISDVIKEDVDRIYQLFLDNSFCISI